MELLVAIGFAAVGLQLALAPSLWAIARAKGGRPGLTVRVLLAFAVLCGGGLLVVQAATWPVLGRLLQVSPVASLLALLGAVALVRVALLAARAMFAPRLGKLALKGPDRHPELLDAVQDAADAVGLVSLPKFAVVECVASPVVTGVFRPVVLFPAHLADLDRHELLIVLIHELAHVKRQHLVWMHLTALLSSAVWPNPVGEAATRAVTSLAEEEADSCVEQLEFSRHEIRATRRRVLAYMSGGAVVLPFASESITSPAPPPTWTLGVPLLGLAGALAPFAVLAQPSLVGYEDSLESLNNRYVLEFASAHGDWARSRYDLVFVESGALYRMRGDGHRGSPSPQAGRLQRTDDRSRGEADRGSAARAGFERTVPDGRLGGSLRTTYG